MRLITRFEERWTDQELAEAKMQRIVQHEMLKTQAPDLLVILADIKKVFGAPISVEVTFDE